MQNLNSKIQYWLRSTQNPWFMRFFYKDKQVMSDTDSIFDPPNQPYLPRNQRMAWPPKLQIELPGSSLLLSRGGLDRGKQAGDGWCRGLRPPVPGTGCAPASAPICRAESFGPNCSSSCFCAALPCPSCPLPTMLPLPPHSKLSCRWKSRISFFSFPKELTAHIYGRLIVIGLSVISEDLVLIFACTQILAICPFWT